MELQHNNKSTILLIDDHPMLCGGVKHLIAPSVEDNQLVIADIHIQNAGLKYVIYAIFIWRKSVGYINPRIFE